MNYYHIFNRGTDKRKIFLCKNDMYRFLDALVVFNYINFKGKIRNIPLEARRLNRTNPISAEDRLLSIHAYCLNPNHYHVIISCDSPETLARFMQKIGIGYTRYFNEKYKRSGVLFQGKYKKVVVESEKQLTSLFAYVNMNYTLHDIPTGQYISSLHEYFSPRDFVINDRGFVTDNFNNQHSFTIFCEEKIKHTKAQRRQKIKESWELD